MRMVVLAVIAAIVFEVFVLVFVASADKTQVRTLPKWAWVLICVITPVLGGIFYLILGRPIAGERPYYSRHLDPEPKPVRINRTRNWLRDFFGLEEGSDDDFTPEPQFRYRDEPRNSPRRGPVAPDDDPEFLRELDRLLKSEASGEPQLEGEVVGDESGSEPGDEPDSKPNDEPGDIK